jgi:hypothetical protein
MLIDVFHIDPVSFRHDAIRELLEEWPKQNTNRLTRRNTCILPLPNLY